jgi:hypothetical protein
VGIQPVALVAVLLWAGLCAADQRALGARQIHQPLVAAVGAGLILHAPERALWIGIWFQLVWAAPMPIGGVILPDTGSAAIAAAVIAAIVPGEIGIGIALATGLLIGCGSIPWERALRDRNASREAAALELQNDARGSAGGGGPAAAPRGESGGRVASGAPARPSLGGAILLGIAGPFARGAASAAGAMILGFSLAAGGVGKGSAVAAASPMGGPIERALLGGAICFGLAGFYVRLRPEAGRTGAGWLIGGVLLGLAGGILLAGGKG